MFASINFAWCACSSRSFNMFISVLTLEKLFYSCGNWEAQGGTMTPLISTFLTINSKALLERNDLEMLLDILPHTIRMFVDLYF